MSFLLLTLFFSMNRNNVLERKIEHPISSLSLSLSNMQISFDRFFSSEQSENSVVLEGKMNSDYESSTSTVEKLCLLVLIAAIVIGNVSLPTRRSFVPTTLI